MTVLAFVRHATTAATGVRLGGWTPGVHLDAAGRAQADALAKRWAKLPVAAVYASPLERTVETARPLARAHGKRVRVRPSFGEVDYGEWTDRPLSQLRRRTGWRTVQATPSRWQFPGGESIRAAQLRAVDATEELVAAHGDELIVVVTHADIIKSVVAHFLAMPLDAFQRITVDPASTTLLVIPTEGTPTLRALNYTGPLTNLLSADSPARAAREVRR